MTIRSTPMSWVVVVFLKIGGKWPSRLVEEVGFAEFAVFRISYFVI